MTCLPELSAKAGNIVGGASFFNLCPQYKKALTYQYTAI